MHQFWSDCTGIAVEPILSQNLQRQLAVRYDGAAIIHLRIFVNWIFDVEKL